MKYKPHEYFCQTLLYEKVRAFNLFNSRINRL